MIARQAHGGSLWLGGVAISLNDAEVVILPIKKTLVFYTNCASLTISIEHEILIQWEIILNCLNRTFEIEKHFSLDELLQGPLTQIQTLLQCEGLLF